MFKRYSVTLIILFIILTLPGAASALGPRAEKMQDIIEAQKQKTVDRLHRLGDKMIDKRISILNKAIDRANKAKRVSEEERSAIIGDLNTNINNLKALKSTIDADNEIDSLKSEVKSIVVDYRIYVVVLPRDRGKMIAGRTSAILNKIDSLSSKLERWINSAKNRGFDVSKIESLYQNFQDQLADAHSQTDEAMNQFSAMQPAADVTEAKNHLAAGKAALRKVRNDLKAARADLRQIIIAFKGLRLGTLSSTQTAQ